MTICVKIAIFMRGGNGENTHRYLLRTAGAFSASLYDLCKENKQRAEGGPLQELAFSMVTPLSGPRPAWFIKELWLFEKNVKCLKYGGKQHSSRITKPGYRRKSGIGFFSCGSDNSSGLFFENHFLFHSSIERSTVCCESST